MCVFAYVWRIAEFKIIRLRIEYGVRNSTTIRFNDSSTYVAGKKETKMPCVILLKEAKIIKIIKSAWVSGINSAEKKTSGVFAHDLARIFYSPNKQTSADFTLELQIDLIANAEACYEAYVLKICGK